MSLRNPKLKALRARRVPAWWLDAKLGIFVHWTPASVPGFAPVDVEIGELLKSGRRDAFALSPYAEWYENSLRFPDSPVARHHRNVWRNRPYEQFADMISLGTLEVRQIITSVIAQLGFRRGRRQSLRHCFFSSQSFWKRGSPRKESHFGSSLRSAGVTQLIYGTVKRC